MSSTPISDWWRAGLQPRGRRVPELDPDALAPLESIDRRRAGERAFQTSRSQQEQVSSFGENYLVNSEMLVEANDREANAARDLLAISHHKQNVLLLSINPNLLQTPGRRPGIFTPRVNKDSG